MKILLTFNDSYAAHACVVIESILDHCSQKLAFVVMYFEGELSAFQIDIISEHFKDRVAEMKFYPVSVDNTRMFDDVEYSKSLSINTFLRLFSPVILTNEDAVLYLDCDLIVLDDINDLMSCADLSKAINAVAEHYPSREIDILKCKKNLNESERASIIQEDLQQLKKQYLGMNEYSAYFNAGVLIINLKLWREQGILADVLDFIKNNRQLPSGDQDALNGVFNGDFGMLPLSWNVHPFVRNLNQYTSKYSESQLISATSEPKLLHFAGYKPWEYLYLDEEHKTLYWKYRALIPPVLGNKRFETGRSISAVLRKKLLWPISTAARTAIGANNIRKIKSIVTKNNK